VEPEEWWREELADAKKVSECKKILCRRWYHLIQSKCLVETYISIKKRRNYKQEERSVIPSTL